MPTRVESYYGREMSIKMQKAKSISWCLKSRSRVGGKVGKMLRDISSQEFWVRYKSSGLISCQDILFYLMGLNLYIIKVSSSSLMENIKHSYRRNFKATVLNQFYLITVDTKMLACSTLFINRKLEISPIFTLSFNFPFKEANLDASLEQ